MVVFEPLRVISWRPGQVSPETGELEFDGWRLERERERERGRR
jgi:hypothetical protein